MVECPSGASGRGGDIGLAAGASRPGWLNRRVLTWSSYDVASSAYFGVVPPLLFPTFFLTVVESGEAQLLSWGAGVSAALLITGLLAPWLGKVADRSNTRWMLLVFGTLACCLATASLSLVGPGHSVLALALFTIAQASYLLSQPLYESYLPMLAGPEVSGRVSSFGWAIGFLGGIIAILAILPLVGNETSHGANVRYGASFLMVGGIFFVLACPALWALRRIVEPETDPGRHDDPGSMWQTLRGWRHHRDLFKVMAAFYFVNGAMVTISVFTMDYFRRSFGTSPRDLLVLLLIYMMIAAPSTFAFGVLADRWSHGKAIFLSLSIWVVAILLMALGTSPWVPMAAVALLGLVFGSTQALFRSLVAQLVPSGREAEFFGFNTAASRVSASMGPVLYGSIATLTASPKIALLSVIVLVVAGAGVLATVRRHRVGERLAVAG
jgi:MFS transporter, UMF1 family